MFVKSLLVLVLVYAFALMQIKIYSSKSVGTKVNFFLLVLVSLLILTALVAVIGTAGNRLPLVK